jgi:hypothetical protein
VNQKKERIKNTSAGWNFPGNSLQLVHFFVSFLEDIGQEPTPAHTLQGEFGHQERREFFFGANFSLDSSIIFCIFRVADEKNEAWNKGIGQI